MQEVLKHLRPEFVNRIDETVIFNGLEFSVIRKIVGIQIESLNTRLQPQNIRIKLSDKAADHIAKEGWDAAFGARPLRRAIQEHIEVPLSMAILGGKIGEGTTVFIDAAGEKLSFATQPSR
jgi:ATP-dependent Clp protease ATP-binding subunit ClpB